MKFLVFSQCFPMLDILSPICHTRFHVATGSNLQHQRRVERMRVARHLDKSGAHILGACNTYVAPAKDSEEAALPVDDDEAPVERLRRSRKVVYRQTGEKKFKCTECTRAFTIKAALIKHLQAHRSRAKRRNLCHTCGRQFEQPGQLQVHLSVHMGSGIHRTRETEK